MIKYTNCKSTDGRLYFVENLRNEIKVTYHTVPQQNYTLKIITEKEKEIKYNYILFADDLYTIIKSDLDSNPDENILSINFTSQSLITSITITFINISTHISIELPRYELVHLITDTNDPEIKIKINEEQLPNTLIPVEATQLVGKHIYFYVHLEDKFNINKVASLHMADPTMEIILVVIDTDIIKDALISNNPDSDSYSMFYQYKTLYIAFLRDNHNTRNNLELIRKLLQILKPCKFSFLSDNIDDNERLIVDPFNIIKSLSKAGIYDEKAIMHFNNLNVDVPPLLFKTAVNKPYAVEVHRKIRDPWYNIITNKMGANRYRVALLLQIGNIKLLNEMALIILNFHKALEKHSLLVMINLPYIDNDNDNDNDNDAFKQQIEEILVKIGITDYVITTGENRGMDLGGFMIQTDFLLRYSYVYIEWIFKFHTKTDDEWRRKMIEELAGTPKTIRNNINTEASVIIPNSYNHDCHLDCHNRRILEWYKAQYGWQTPKTFSAGTMFGIRWSILLLFWTKISIHSPEQTFNLFKNHYVTNNRESFAHAWERILSGHLPYNYDNSYYITTLLRENPIQLRFQPVTLSILTKLYKEQKLTYIEKSQQSLKLSNKYWEKPLEGEAGEAEAAEKDGDIVIYDTPIINIVSDNNLKILLISWKSYLSWALDNFDDVKVLNQYVLILAEDEQVFNYLLNMGITHVFLRKNVESILHCLLFNVCGGNHNSNTNNQEDLVIRVYCDCANNPHDLASWGDYIMAKNLKWELINKLGMNVVIDTLFDNREYGAEKYFYMAGYDKFRVNPIKTNYLWIYSHPMQKTYLQNNFSKIFVASKNFMYQIEEELGSASRSKLYYLPQIFVCNTELDTQNNNNSNYTYNISFIGNSRNVYRDSVKTILDGGYRLNIWGKGWSKIIPDEYQNKVSIKWINNSELRKVLRASKIIINDHWPDMRKEGFISMKTYEFMANKAFFITDKVMYVDEIGQFVTYETNEELKSKLNYYLSRPEERRIIVDSLYEFYVVNYVAAIKTLSEAL